MKIRKSIKPILFSTAMVQALLQKRKNQTRREVVSQSPEMTALMINILAGVNVEINKAELFRSAPIQKGDVLWVRENWMFWGANLEFGECTFKFQTGDLHTWDINEDKNQGEWVQEQFNKLEEQGVFKLVEDAEPDEDELYYNRTDKAQSWKPSIHMPKEASRIFLKVTDVRIEEVQKISEDDAIAEGIEDIPGLGWKNYLKTGFLPFGCSLASDSFKTLWQSINGAESWELNPLVWAYSFEIIERPKDF